MTSKHMNERQPSLTQAGGHEVPASGPHAVEAKACESLRLALERVLYVPRSPYQRPTRQEEEMILACFMLTGNMREVARRTSWSVDVIKRVATSAEEVGLLHDLHLKQREQFVEKAWSIIMTALRTIDDGLRKGYVKGRSFDRETGEEVHLVSRVGPGEAAAVLQKLHKVVLLHETQKPDIVQQIAQSMTKEEILAEAERTYAQIQARKGLLL